MNLWGEQNVLVIVVGTYRMLTMRPTPAVINMTSAFIVKSLVLILSVARYTKIPVKTQMINTETSAPRTSIKKTH